MKIDIANSLSGSYYDKGTFENQQQKISYFLAAYTRSGNIKAIEQVLMHGGNINEAVFEDENGNMYNPLQYAVIMGKKDLVEFIISKGADTSVKYYDGSNLLHKALGGDAKIADISEVAKILINNGVDINTINDNKESPLFKILSLKSFEGWNSDIRDVFNQILDSTDNLEIPLSYTSLIQMTIFSPLYQPLGKKGEEDIYVADAVKKLLDKGAPMEKAILNNNIVSELGYALDTGQHHVAKLLVCYGANKDLISESRQQKLAELGEFECDTQFTAHPMLHEDL